MISETMCGLGKESSVIRAIFEYGRKRAAEIGAENVFDFSLGNPNVPVPEDVKKAMKELLDCGDDVWLHGYTSGNGDAETRKAIAEDLNRRFGTVFRPENLYMTCGAAASLKSASPLCVSRAMNLSPLRRFSRSTVCLWRRRERSWWPYPPIRIRSRLISTGWRKVCRSTQRR